MIGQQIQKIKKDFQPFTSLEQVNNLVEGLTAKKFHKIASYPLWNLIAETFDYTRSYEQGLEFGLKLLKYADTFRVQFNPKEQEHHYQNLYFFMLNNLDKLDRWEEYLDTWEKIRTNTIFTTKYPKSIRNRNEGIIGQYFEPIESYILSEDDTSLYVHFLYGISNRRKVIKRKLQRKQAGKKLGNLFHARQEQLTEEQIKERFDMMRRKAKYLDEIETTLQRMRSNYRH